MRCNNCGKIYKKDYNLAKHTLICQPKVAPVNDDKKPAKIEHGEMFCIDEQTLRIFNEQPQQINNEQKQQLAPYNPDDSPRTQCRNLYKFTSQFMTEISLQITKLQENQQLLFNIVKNSEKPKVGMYIPPINSQNLFEKIKQVFVDQKNYDKPDVTFLNLTPQSILELCNLHGENIVEEMVKMIWFNKNIPQNYSVILLNSSTGESAYYKDGWRKDKFKNIISVFLNFLDSFMGIGLTPYLTMNPTYINIQAKRAREQFMNVRQSFKNSAVTKGAIPAYVAAYYEKIKDLAELMTEELIRANFHKQ